MTFYFQRFEHRSPRPPIPHSPWRERLYQFLATIALVLGAWYLHWRWTASLNYEALWFAVPMVLAETLAFIGLILFTANIWKTRDTPISPPPASIRECVEEGDAPDRPVAVDIFFTTYDEEIDLVRLGIRDALALRYPHAIDLRIHILDDGRRPEMAAMASAEGVGYITRSTNLGFKAGNLRNALEATSGDFVVICDADTRPLPTLLERTLGYFRDPDVAWVQTPQWFYDLPEGTPLPEALRRWLGGVGALLGRGIERIAGPIHVGNDPFVNDPELFYQIIQRRRNWANASFCCGAGSIHRREAVMQAALTAYAETIERQARHDERQIRKLTREGALEESTRAQLRGQAALETEFTPYKFHVSEDIYTSIVLHSDPNRTWKSVFHPWIETKMLSPRDLLSWTIQRYKYAGGTLDILKNDNPLFRRGLSFWQRVMYGATFWSYLAGLWNLVFLAAPIIYLFSGIAPVSAYSVDFYKHILPFLVANEIAMMVGTWGIAGYKAKLWYLSFFPLNLRAIWAVVRGEQIKFKVTPKARQSGSFHRLVLPQIGIVILTLAAFGFAMTAFLLGSETYTAGGLIANGFWAANNIIAMSGIILAAFWQPDDEDITERTEEAAA
ncbi:glycosyltransferase [Paracoccus tibetensis]|uniref:Cellulose synthase (UDP-forming) n=1 Tax=Paracoccus tibetensis TaxID=336292 RepID=A0A1G5JM57_9RHOB|nr:glycosyltransferase [Paracoccus tibetensis]SCY88829.1 cellulose synthase (UDP-forming) [Paracoccus tibetensis]